MIKDLPEKLKTLRLQNNLTQKIVAHRLNLSPSIISGYECGDRTPSIEVLLALSSLYKCSTDYLLGKDNTKPKVCLDTDGLSEEQLRVIQDMITILKKSAE